MNSEQGFFQLFAQGRKGGGGGLGHAPLGFRNFITHNLVESGTVFTHNFTIYCAIKDFIKA